MGKEVKTEEVKEAKPEEAKETKPEEATETKPEEATETKENSIETAAAENVNKGAADAVNPITPVPNADKDCDASPPKAKLGNKTIKRKLDVVDATTTGDGQPNKKHKLDNQIKA